MPNVDSNGWSIHFETAGQRGRPPLVMILGLSHRLAHWGRLPALLAERLFVVTFDCRGMGDSDRRDEPFTIADEVQDVLAVAGAAGLERFALYGRSRGGMLAQEVALIQPDRVSSLILSGTGHRGPGSAGWSEVVTKAMNFTPDMSREQIFEAQNIAMASPGWKERDPEAFAELMRTDMEAPPRRFAVVRQQEALAGWTSHGRLERLTMPTLVLCGEDDGMQPAANSRQLAEAIPGARLQIIPQCGHLPMLEKPDEVAAGVFSFLGV
jgi:pimeloyl-ACP methyl ester carboxylesterase